MREETGAKADRDFFCVVDDGFRRVERSRRST
jgi:hypothetical protein